MHARKAQYHQALPQRRQNKNPQEASETNTLHDGHLNGLLPLISYAGQQAHLKNVCRGREGRSKQPEEQRRADMVAIRNRSRQHPGCSRDNELLPAYFDQANCGGVILLQIQDIWSLLARPNPDAAAVYPAVREEEETETCLLAIADTLRAYSIASSGLHTCLYIRPCMSDNTKESTHTKLLHFCAAACCAGVQQRFIARACIVCNSSTSAVFT